MENISRTQKKLDPIFKSDGYADFVWINPKQIIVSQWVRMKCMYGCGAYGRCASCPPNVPSISDCEKFFREYKEAAIFHFEKKVNKPEDRHAWTQKVNLQLVELERKIFLSGYERAFLLAMDNCTICSDCTVDRATCREPALARPTPEAMGMDVYSTVRQFGLTINVRTDYHQKMDRYAFLMVN